MKKLIFIVAFLTTALSACSDNTNTNSNAAPKINYLDAEYKGTVSDCNVYELSGYGLGATRVYLTKCASPGTTNTSAKYTSGKTTIQSSNTNP
jgi:ABC-type Fe3+-hydroxamate transport system substrate-binding protein